MATLYGWDGGSWRAAVYYDFWDGFAWGDVRELWAWAGGAWQQVYLRARAIDISRLFVSETNQWVVQWTTDGVGIGTIGWEVLVDGVVQDFGTTTAGAFQSSTVPGGAGAIVTIRLRNVRNRVIGNF